MKPISYILAACFLISSCGEDKYLDLYPETSLSEGTFYNTLPELQAAVDDIYRQMGRLYDAGGIPSLYGSLFSDDGAVVAQLAGIPIHQPIDEHQIASSNSAVQDAWDVAYNVIYICNNAIRQINITEIEIDPALKSRMLAEATLIRSLAYFNLVRAYGAVPLITEVISPTEAYDYLRESPEKVYRQIVADLSAAKEALPESYSGADVGRVTRYSAAAVLAKVHMTTGNMQAAGTELEFIMNSGQFSLDANGDGTVNTADYLYIFAPETKNCRASVLEAQYLAGPNAVNSGHQLAFAPYSDAFNHPLIQGSVTRGGGYNTPTVDLAEEFEPGDPRKEVTIVPGFPNLSTGTFIDYPFTLKYFDPNWFNPGQNFEIIRYADILLMYAEVSGDASYLNQVRERVGLVPFGSADYPSDQYPTLELAIEHERRMELSLEFHRFFDLVRTGRAAAVMQGKVPGFSSEKLLFPIPLYAIDVNPGLTQNPGY